MSFVRAARVRAPNFWGRSIARLAVLAGILMVTACATVPGLPSGGGAGGADVASSSSHQKIGAPYQVRGVWYVPTREDHYDETGVASWYGPGFHGRDTSNGETFDENLISAAHTTLPLPSIVRVRNLDNGREITARLNDRGPFVDDRIIDLSRAAARELGFERQGTARVRVQYLGPAEPGQMAARPGDTRVAEAEPEPAPERRSSRRRREGEGDLYVQAGSFRDRDRADTVASRLGEGGPAFVERARVGGQTYHRVMTGPWSDQGDANDARRRAVRLGLADAKIVDGR